MDTNIKYLLTYCQDLPELYNKVSNKLYIEFGIQSAELSLLCTYMINEWRKKETETWNGIHAQITAPKGTFERIFNDADDDIDI